MTAHRNTGLSLRHSKSLFLIAFPSVETACNTASDVLGFGLFQIIFCQHASYIGRANNSYMRNINIPRAVS
jgi:hypothetical protein